MNTPTHITLALALLGKKNNPKRNKSVIAGALLPDVAMFFLFFYEVIIQTPQRVIWEEKYFSPLWQNTTDLFNSIPIFVSILIFAWYKKIEWLQLVCLGALLHIAFDLPLHHDDGHRHFFPLTDWRFESPISYWDPAYYGQYWSVFELVLLLGTGYVAWNMLASKWAKAALLIVVIVNIAMPAFYYLTLG